MNHVQNVRTAKGQGKLQKDHVGILKDRKYELVDSEKSEGNSFHLTSEKVPLSRFL